MSRSYGGLILVFVGLAIGAGVAIIQEAPEITDRSSDPIGVAFDVILIGTVAVLVFLVAISLVAGLLVGFVTFLTWPREYQVSVLIGLLTIGFIVWVTVIGSPSRVTSDMRVVDTLPPQERTAIRGGAVGLLAFSSLLLVWVVKHRTRSIYSNDLNGP